MILLRKYGAAATIDGVPLIARDTLDFKSNPTLASGDVKIEKDGAAAANVATLPTVTPAGGTSVQIVLSASEMQAARIVVRFVDQTSPKEWEDQEIVIETYGHASAQHAVDWSVATPTNFNLLAIDSTGRMDVGKWLGTAPAVLSGGAYLQTDMRQIAGTTGAATNLSNDYTDWGHMLARGTLAAAGAATATLDAGAVASADYYKGCRLVITSGTGAGQERIIASYTAGRVATLSAAWTTSPDASSKYVVIPAAIGGTVDGVASPLAFQYVAAATAGQLSGAGTNTETFVGLDGSTSRVTATVDSNGNRTAINYG